MLKRLKLQLKLLYNSFPFVNRISAKKHCLENHGAVLRKCDISISGENNKVIFKKKSVLSNCEIHVVGNHNIIEIGENCRLNHVTIWIEDNNNKVVIGDRAHFTGKCHLAAIEGTTINIGDRFPYRGFSQYFGYAGEQDQSICRHSTRQSCLGRKQGDNHQRGIYCRGYRDWNRSNRDKKHRGNALYCRRRSR